MIKTFRYSLTVMVLAAAVASHAALNFAGLGPVSGGTTTTLGYTGDSYNLAKSTSTTNLLTITDTFGTSGFNITFAPAQAFTSTSVGTYTGNAVGFGALAGTSFGTSVSTINTVAYGVFAQNTAVPEPSAFAALGLGGLGLLRRRRKA